MPETVDQKPVELTLGDGTVVKGANMEEAFNNLRKITEDRGNSYRTAKEEAERYRQEAQTYGAELEQFKAPKVKDGEFDKNHYYKLLNEDPIQADVYLDKHKYGVEDPVQRFNEVATKTDELYQQYLTAAFWQRHQDFPGGSEAAQKMTERVAELTRSGIPLTHDTMDLAYQRLVSEGTIKPAKVEPEQTERPNPSLGGGASPENVLDDDKLMRMSEEEFRAYARKQGLKSI